MLSRWWQQRRATAVGLFLMLAGCGTAPVASLPGPWRTQAVPQGDLADLYQWVADHRAEEQYIPCTCGCRAVGHTSNFSCFVREVRNDGTVVYDDHGLRCNVCRRTAEETRAHLAKGEALPEVRAYIDRTFHGLPTDTPLPPAPKGK